MNNLILQRYKVINKAGEGGFGTVLVAWDTRMRRRVAIKCIELKNNFIDVNGETVNLSGQTQYINGQNSADISNQKTHVVPDRINKSNKKKQVDSAGEHWQDNVPGLSEARTAAMIQDSNIVTVYDFELEGNTAYIIMEYVQGVTLTQFLEQAANEITLDMITCIFSGISHALEVAHSQNVLHLDIKPDNVLIDSTGKVKVTDFGLATLADEFGYGSAEAGTIGYMPPEQMRREALDSRCDQWALASITYEMLTGTNPFDAKDIKGSLNKVLDAKLVPPSSFWENLNKEVDDSVFKALSADCGKRFGSILEFSSNLLPNLSSAKSGKRQLASLFKNNDDVFDHNDTRNATKIKNKKPFFESFTSNSTMSIIAKIYAAFSSAFVSLIGLINIPFFEGNGTNWLWMPNIYGILAMLIVAVCSAIIPSIGLSLALLLFSVALILYNNFIVGIILIVLTCAWFVFVGRKSIADSNCLSLFPLCGSFGVSLCGPIITGLFCKPLNALITTFFGFLICLILSALGSESLIGWEAMSYIDMGNVSSMSGVVEQNLLHMITNIGLWIMGFSWVLSAFVTSVMMMLKQRFFHVLAPIVSTVFLIAGVCLYNFFGSNMLHFQPQWWQILPAIIAGAVGVVIALFMPRKSAELY